MIKLEKPLAQKEKEIYKVKRIDGYWMYHISYLYLATYWLVYQKVLVHDIVFELVIDHYILLSYVCIAYKQNT